MNGSADGDLLAKTASGAGWTIAWRVATRTLGFLSTLVLARLLVPGDFGLVALGTGLAQALDVFSLIGVQQAVIREKAPTTEFYNTAFTMNAIRGCVTAVLIEALAYPGAAFYHDPRLANILHVLALVMLAEACENIGTLDFRRDFTFDKEFRLFVVPRLVGVTAAVGSAILLRSYWALVIGLLTTRGLRTVFSYVMHPFRPRLSLAAWRQLTAFSAWTWAINIVALLQGWLPELIVGRILGAVSVGQYAVGAEIAALPATELVEPIGRACVSSFAAARNAGLNPERIYVRVAATTFLLSLPAGIGLVLVADPLVKLALGPNWVSAIPVVRVLGVIGTTGFLASYSASLLSVHARLRPSFFIALAGAGARGALLIGLLPRYGITGAAVAIALAMAVEQALYLGVIRHCYGVHLSVLAANTCRPAAAAAVMAAVMLTTGTGGAVVDGSAGVLTANLLGSALFGAAIYGLTLLALWVAMGRPPGAEADALELIRRTLLRLPPPLRRRPAGSA